jgi:hypothetical protein
MNTAVVKAWTWRALSWRARKEEHTPDTIRLSASFNVANVLLSGRTDTTLEMKSDEAAVDSGGSAP